MAYTRQSKTRPTNISEVLQNQAVRNQATFRVSRSGNFYLHENKTHSQHDFESKYPVEVKTKYPNGLNAQGKYSHLL